MASDLDAAGLLRLYRTMATIRAFDARIRRGLAAGEFAFSYWPVEGQEAISAGVGACLAPGDPWVTTYRCAADAIAKGVPLRGDLGREGRGDGRELARGRPRRRDGDRRRRAADRERPRLGRPAAKDRR